MKTLSEVIEAFERAEKRWTNDPHSPLEYSEFRDALTYLRGYQNRLKEERDHDADIIDAYRYALLCHNHNQAKLGWVELQEMFGKPVFYVRKDDSSRKGWVIIYELHITECGLFLIGTDEHTYPLESYDFYRREFE